MALPGLDLLRLQRALHAADTVDALFASAAASAPRTCGFERGLILAAEGNRLTSVGAVPVEHPPSDALRRQMQATAVGWGSAEAEVIRRADGRAVLLEAGSSELVGMLDLREAIVAPIIPEHDVVALVIVERAIRTVSNDEVARVELFAHLLGLALERTVLRSRVREATSELRHLAASAMAMLHDAAEAPVVPTTQMIYGPVFTATGSAVAEPSDAITSLLTEREQAVAALMVTGCSNKEIGEQMHLSPDTVKVHVARLIRKLGASNRVEAAARYAGMAPSPGSG